MEQQQDMEVEQGGVQQQGEQQNILQPRTDGREDGREELHAMEVGEQDLPHEMQQDVEPGESMQQDEGNDRGGKVRNKINQPVVAIVVVVFSSSPKRYSYIGRNEEKTVQSFVYLQMVSHRFAHANNHISQDGEDADDTVGTRRPGRTAIPPDRVPRAAGKGAATRKPVVQMARLAAVATGDKIWAVEENIQKDVAKQREEELKKQLQDKGAGVNYYEKSYARRQGVPAGWEESRKEDDDEEDSDEEGDDQPCLKCGDPDWEFDNNWILLCDSDDCKGAIHLLCHKPPLKKIPDGSVSST